MHSLNINLCVLGDSHTVALRRALARPTTEPSPLKIQLIASARDGMRSTRLNGTRLEATTEKVAEQFIRTSGGNPFVDLEPYDAIALCGLGMNLQSLFYILNTHQPLNPLFTPTTKNIISPAALQAAIQDAVNTSIAGWLLPQIRTISAKPIWLIPQPAPDASITQLSHKWPWLKDTQASILLQLLHDNLGVAIKNLSDKFDARILQQPQATLTEDGFSLSKYLQLGKQQDSAHMNADYGIIVLRQLEQALTPV